MDRLDTDAEPARRQHGQPGGDAAFGVTEIYGAHAVSMIRIALIMLGDRAAAEDVVQDVGSAEALALMGEDRRRILAAVQRLPGRQRETLVCRFYLELSEEETARAMRVSRGTVKSATSRAVAALGRMLKEG